MSPMDALPDFLLRLLPGALGASAAAAWTHDPIVRRAVTFIGGTAFSYGATPELAPHLHLGPFVLGVLLGACSMMVLHKTFDTLHAFPLGRILRDWSRRKLGLPPEPPTKPGEL